MRVFMASDFHLQIIDNQNERQIKVLKFLDSLIGNADLLILNGDIFDFWIVWKNAIIKQYFPILKKLADIKESGCRIVFIAGNHDFWFKDFLVTFLEIEVYNDNFIEDIDGKKIFVSHGDIYTTNDLRYKIFRTIIRNRLVRKTIEMLHPNIAVKLANKLSRSSRSRKISTKLHSRREEGLNEFARKTSSDFDVIIFGHSHFPKMENIGNCVYANCGDWISNNSYIKMVDGKVELCRFG